MWHEDQFRIQQVMGSLASASATSNLILSEDTGILFSSWKDDDIQLKVMTRFYSSDYLSSIADSEFAFKSMEDMHNLNNQPQAFSTTINMQDSHELFAAYDTGCMSELTNDLVNTSICVEEGVKTMPAQYGKMMKSAH